VTRELRPGLVSIVVVNFRGADDTLVCLHQLLELDLAPERAEIICVDNASGDDSLDRLRTEAPPLVNIVASPVNGGFTGGCNLGVRQATGEYVAFINSDARPDAAWLSEALAVLERDSTVGCVASKVLDWEGGDVDFVDAALTWYGMGYKPGAGSAYDGSRERPDDVLFATGSAMIVRTALFEAVGGFDERFFMFYEDVDLGWRLNLLGHRVRYVPTSLVYHKHHASIKKFGAFREWFLLERNALMSLYKNVEDSTLSVLFGPALALSIRRSLATGEADTSVLDLQRNQSGDDQPTVTVSKQSLTGAYAVDSLVDHLPSLAKTRADLQNERVRSDRELMPLLRNAIEPAIPNERYLAGHAALVDAFGIAEIFGAATRVLIVTGDPLTAQMAGPAIRAFHIAEALSAEHPVRLVSTTFCAIDDPRFACSAKLEADLRADVAWAEVVLFQGFLMDRAPWLAGTDAIIVADLYDPMHLEQLEQTRGEEPTLRTRDVASTTGALNDQLRRGDFFLCASEKQRHFWLGQMAALGRLNPSTYDSDSTLKSLVAVAPFGLPDEPPAQRGSPIKSGTPGISADDKVILWAGGIYNWFDPLTLVRAVAQLAGRHPDVRLYFLGTRHPNPNVPTMRMVAQTRALSDAMGLTNTFVFFNEGWVDYDRRQDYLLDADVGVSTHFEHLETTFSFRTRILDYLWANLPMVVTGGDTFGDLVTAEGLGVAVPEQDVDALAAGLERALYDEPFAAQCRENVARVALRFRWSEVLRPLVEFCRAPRHAADISILADGRSVLGERADDHAVLTTRANRSVLTRNMGYARDRVQEGGVRHAAELGLAKARRVLLHRRPS